MKYEYIKIIKEQGEFNFEVSAMVEELTQEEYKELKSMLITAIGTMEETRRIKREDAFTGYKWFARGKEIMSMEYTNEEEKDIEQIPDIIDEDNRINGLYWSEVERMLLSKVNELVREVKKLKKEGK